MMRIRFILYLTPFTAKYVDIFSIFRHEGEGLLAALVHRSHMVPLIGVEVKFDAILLRLNCAIIVGHFAFFLKIGVGHVSFLSTHEIYEILPIVILHRTFPHMKSFKRLWYFYYFSFFVRCAKIEIQNEKMLDGLNFLIFPFFFNIITK